MIKIYIFFHISLAFLPLSSTDSTMFHSYIIHWSCIINSRNCREMRNELVFTAMLRSRKGLHSFEPLQVFKTNTKSTSLPNILYFVSLFMGYLFYLSPLHIGYPFNYQSELQVKNMIPDEGLSYIFCILLKLVYNSLYFAFTQSSCISKKLTIC